MRLHHWLAVTGLMSLAGGLAYLAGPLRHPFALLWGAYALSGGAVALYGAVALRKADRQADRQAGEPPPRRLLRAALIGFGLFMAGQFPPLHFYYQFALSPFSPDWRALVLSVAAGHTLLLAASAAGLLAAGRATPGRPGWAGERGASSVIRTTPRGRSTP